MQRGLWDPYADEGLDIKIYIITTVLHTTPVDAKVARNIAVSFSMAVAHAYGTNH